MKVRYCGPDAGRDLALPGGVIQFDRLKWVNIDKACEEAGIGLHHLEVVIPALGDDWEIEQTKPTAKKAS